VADVEAVAPGSVAVSFEGTNQFSDPVSTQAVATVLDASRFQLQLGAANHVTVKSRPNGYIFIPDHELSPGGLRVAITAVPVDARYSSEPKEQPDYSSGLTSIEWTTDNQFILFDVGIGPDPTASDVLTLDLVPNVAGEDVVHVTALNSLNQPISATMRILVLATASASISESA
jgi:hypothetical protein